MNSDKKHHNNHPRNHSKPKEKYYNKVSQSSQINYRNCGFNTLTTLTTTFAFTEKTVDSSKWPTRDQNEQANPRNLHMTT